MRNIAVFLRYDGTDFHGFQVQKNAVSVQETLQNALEELFGHETTVCGCSRTDAGVHARMYCALTKTDTAIPTKGIVQGLNALLPDSVAAYKAYEVGDDFHPRYSAISKEYEYRIYYGKARNPFCDRYAYWHPRTFNASLLEKAAPYFEGTHDFCGFMASGSAIVDTVRTVYSCRAEVDAENEQICIRIRANGFLYNMVRIIVGTLLDVASGKIPFDTLSDVIDSKDRSKAGFTAPAKGLSLIDIEYEKGIFGE